MYTAKIKLNNKEFKGTLTFSTLNNIEKIMLKEFKKELSIKDILEGLSNFDMTIFSVFILETLNCEENSKEDILYNFENDPDILNKFKNGYNYINELIDECLPRIKDIGKNESIFEDEEEEIGVSKWEYDYMEYIWSTLLKRNDFWNTTPKNFFEQIKIHEKINKTDSSDIQREEL